MQFQNTSQRNLMPVSIHSLVPLPSTRQSMFCLCGFDSSGHLTKVESYSMRPFVSGFFMFWKFILAIACTSSSFLLIMKQSCPCRPQFISSHLHWVPERIFQANVDESFWGTVRYEAGDACCPQTPLLMLPGHCPFVVGLSGILANLKSERGTVWQTEFQRLFESHDKPTSMEPGQALEKEASAEILQAAFLHLFPVSSPWQPHTVIKRAEGKVSDAFLYSGLVSFDIPNRTIATR